MVTNDSTPSSVQADAHPARIALLDDSDLDPEQARRPESEGEHENPRTRGAEKSIESIAVRCAPADPERRARFRAVHNGLERFNAFKAV